MIECLELNHKSERIALYILPDGVLGLKNKFSQSDQFLNNKQLSSIRYIPVCWMCLYVLLCVVVVCYCLVFFTYAVLREMLSRRMLLKDGGKVYLLCMLTIITTMRPLLHLEVLLHYFLDHVPCISLIYSLLGLQRFHCPPATYWHSWNC